MQICLIALRPRMYKRLPFLLIALFFSLNTSPLPISNSETHSFGIAAAAPPPLRDQSARTSASSGAKVQREIELVSSNRARCNDPTHHP